MKARKRLASLALALLTALTLLPAAALADEWENTTDVTNYEEFTAALKDEKVQEIKIVGEVAVPAEDEPLWVETPVLVANEGKLTLEPEAVMYAHVPMGRFNFEDREKTWDLVAEMCDTFIIWHPEENTYNRGIFGTQPDISSMVKEAREPVNCLVVDGDDLTLTEDLTVESSLQVYGHDLTIAKGVKVEAGYLYVDGSITLEEGASLTLGEEGGTVTGKVNAADEKQIPESLKPPVPPADESAAPKFTDVAADSPFAKAIDWAVAGGITNGKTETTFGPGDTCTISHILTFLWRANGKPGAEEGVSDRDSAIKWAKELKLIGELENVDDPCTRVMAVACMWRVAGNPGPETEISFTDVDMEADYAPAIAWAVGQGVTTGTGSGTTFSPFDTCTRGQIVTFLFRAANAAAEQSAEG